MSPRKFIPRRANQKKFKPRESRSKAYLKKLLSENKSIKVNVITGVLESGMSEWKKFLALLDVSNDKKVDECIKLIHKMDTEKEQKEKPEETKDEIIRKQAAELLHSYDKQ